MKRYLQNVIWVILILSVVTLSATAQTNKKVDLSIKISINFNDNSVSSILNTISKKAGIKIVYDVSDMQELPKKTGSYTDITLAQLLDICLSGSKYKYQVIRDAIVIERPTKMDRITVYGRVTDRNKVPLPGAHVILKGTKVGVSADEKGNYRINFMQLPKMELEYGFLGSESRTIQITKSGEMNIMLSESANSVDEIVVNGMYTRSASTFTGSVTTLKGEDILAVSSTDLLGSIAALTPGMVLVENNAQGSNPNTVPEILIRGANSVVTSAEQKAYNNPLVILDGAEISIEELYDLDMFDIERVDVLKDAQASIVYGDRAANGVIVIERNRVKDRNVKLSYNFVPNFSIPDLSSINLCNAEQKLQLETYAGLYDSPSGDYDEAYARKLQNVRRGVNTDWLHAPLRTPFSHTHSLQLSGGANKVDYRASLRFSDQYGIMRGDNRRNYNMTFYVGYHVADKLTIGYRANYTMTESKASPYGDFADYTKLNPYEPVYDEFGEMNKKYYFYPGLSSSSAEQLNPLYDATLSSFNTASSQQLRNTLDAKWYITKLFFVTGQFNVDINKNQTDKFTSPDAATYISQTDPSKRGEYQLSTGKGFKYSGQIVVNYSKILSSDGSGFALNAGADIDHTKSNNAAVMASGFLKDNLNDIKFAMNYKPDSHPSGQERLTARAGFFAAGNFYFRNRYFADISYRTSGSSTYGSNNRWAPTWATGLGWNIHKEKFMESSSKWLDVLRLKWSYGYSGNVSYNPYQAMTTYNYTNNLGYYTGIGANPITMGNPNLKWQRTLKNNFGIQSTMFKNRLNVSVDYYINTSKDLLMNVIVPASIGVKSVPLNFGELRNKGVDISLSGTPIKTENFSWTMAINGAHVFDQLRKISPTLKDETYNLFGGESNIRLRFIEGGSQYDIYAMRSAGIDPATGQEIFINRAGEYTYKYRDEEEVVVGNTNPSLQGAWLNTLRYKNFTLSLTFQYTFGSDVYNETLFSKVENIDPRQNVDARAFTDRWKNPGDLSRYLGINANAQDNTSERFVERYNELYLSKAQITYEFAPKALKKLGIKRLQVGFGMDDIVRFSTVKFERGTSYPYARNFNISIRPTF